MEFDFLVHGSGLLWLAVPKDVPNVRLDAVLADLAGEYGENVQVVVAFHQEDRAACSSASLSVARVCGDSVFALRFAVGGVAAGRAVGVVAAGRAVGVVAAGRAVGVVAAGRAVGVVAAGRAVGGVAAGRAVGVVAAGRLCRLRHRPFNCSLDKTGNLDFRLDRDDLTGRLVLFMRHFARLLDDGVAVAILQAVERQHRKGMLLAGVEAAIARGHGALVLIGLADLVLERLAFRVADQVLVEALVSDDHWWLLGGCRRALRFGLGLDGLLAGCHGSGLHRFSQRRDARQTVV